VPNAVADFALVYVDDALIVVNKAAGQLSVPGRGADKQDCLSTRVQQHYPDACVVHRLDMATSGLLLLARGAAVQRQLNACFARRQIHKRYEAVVTGLVQANPALEQPGWSCIDLPMRLDWPNRPKSVIDPVQGKPSLTRWQLLSVDQRAQTTRLLLEPVTGRSHQLRVHLLAIGHPIRRGRAVRSHATPGHGPTLAATRQRAATAAPDRWTATALCQPATVLGRNFSRERRDPACCRSSGSFFR
jgi:tRNA pseudouridine32 synthase/23S rRNA pseudouridine746 synthase